MRAKREPPTPYNRALVREVRARALVTIDRGNSRGEHSRELSVRFDENRLRAPAYGDLLTRPALAGTRLTELIQRGIQALLRGITSLMVGPVLRRMLLARDRIRSVLAAQGRASESGAALGLYLEVAAFTAAAAMDPSCGPSLLILEGARPMAPGDPVAALTTELVALMIGDQGTRDLLVPDPPLGWLAHLLGWWPWKRRGHKWRRQRIMAALAACDLLPGDAIHNTKRFLEVPDYLDVVSELARLFVDLVPAAGAEEDDRPLPDTEEEFLALLLGRLSADHPNLGAPGSSPPPDGDPNIGGFNPGSGSPPPPARLDLAQWYWSRAPILDALPDLKIRKLDKIERDVVGLERVQTRESVSHGVKLERPLRHRAFRPVEDDPAEIDFSHVMVSGDVPIVDYLTFGVGRIHPAIAVPVERRWSTLRETLRRETALVEIEFDVANLAGGADLFDQILFVRDSSGSMGGFKEGTPLDCVTLGVFSVLKTLEFREEARRFRYGAVDFSNSTHFSGYVGWDNRDEFERVVLTGQNGGTTVDVGVVREALSGPDRTLVLFLSDGELAVSAGTPDELITLLMKHSPYVVAAGGLSTFCKQCADAGIVTLILDRIDSVATVFSAIATGTA